MTPELFVQRSFKTGVGACDVKLNESFYSFEVLIRQEIITIRGHKHMFHAQRVT